MSMDLYLLARLRDRDAHASGGDIFDPLSPREVLGLLRGLAGLNIVGGDVMEVAPQHDPASNTAQVAAQMLFEILGLVALSPSPSMNKE